MPSQNNNFPVSPQSPISTVIAYPSVARIVDQVAQSAPYEPNSPTLACLDAPDTVQIYYFPINIPASGPALADVIVNFPTPVRRVFVASITSSIHSNSLWFHFAPLGIVYSSTPIYPTGNEQWIPFPRASAGGNILGSGFKFCKPISRFYLDIGKEAGGAGGTIMLAGTNDIDEPLLYANGALF
jgi:hypothetical protein